VGNLSYETEEGDLEDLFKAFGKIDNVKVAMDRDSGRSKGFAFVTLDQEESDAAIKALDESEFLGRRIRVNVARPRDDSRRRFDNSRDRSPRGNPREQSPRRSRYH
jgi:cold-inducible RNA-binding protein